MYPCTPRYILLARLELHSFSQALIKDKSLKTQSHDSQKCQNESRVFVKDKLSPLIHMVVLYEIL